MARLARVGWVFGQLRRRRHERTAAAGRITCAAAMLAQRPNDQVQARAAAGNLLWKNAGPHVACNDLFGCDDCDLRAVESTSLTCSARLVLPQCLRSASATAFLQGYMCLADCTGTHEPSPRCVLPQRSQTHRTVLAASPEFRTRGVAVLRSMPRRLAPHPLQHIVGRRCPEDMCSLVPSDATRSANPRAELNLQIIDEEHQQRRRAPARDGDRGAAGCDGHFFDSRSMSGLWA